ncbi:MAG: carbohydrate kinase [Oscillospiraceae bacterium]|nr:carbohydrate kinase [Oscillospiraceae bacterium]
MSLITPFSNDIVALGELLIDFTESGVSSNGNRLFEQNPGGAPANLLTAAARLGCKTAFIGKVGRDMHGAFLKETLEKEGIDTRGLVETDEVFTTLAFVALSDTGEREFSFARKPGADTCLKTDEIDFELIKSSRIFHFGSLSLTEEPAREATAKAVSFAGENGVTVTYDPNYRASLWNSGEAAVEQMKKHIESVDIIKIADNEVEMVTGERDLAAGAKKLCDMGVKCAAVTLGPDGALVCVGGRTKTIGAYDVAAVDTTGAGDAFFGGFLYSFLASGISVSELTLEAAAEFARVANAVAAVCVGKRGGIPAMPTLAELKALAWVNGG